MSQIFDGGGSQSGVSDDSGLLSAAVDEAIISRMVIPPQPVPSQVASALGQDGIPAMWPGSMRWEARLTVIPSVTLRRMDVVHTWNQDSISTGNLNNDIFATQAHIVTIRKIDSGTVVKRMLVVRRWTGLGGSPVYIPSFPQLSRQETSFPHAT